MTGTVSVTSVPPDRIRLLFVSASLYTGGAERQLVQLVRGLDPARYEMTVAVFIGPETATQEGFYGQVAELPHVRLEVLRRSGRFDVAGPILSLVKLIRSRHIQLIHTYLNLASTFGVIAARLAGVPIVASAIRDSRDIGLTYRLCRVVQAYGADALLSNSAAGFDNRFRHWRANFHVIPNGLDLRRFASQPDHIAQLREDLHLGRFTKLIGMVATLSGFKDHEAFLQVALRVLQQQPEVGFLVIGDGPNRASLEARCLELGLARNVVFTGYRRDIDVLTGILDVACLFTNYRVISEGLPNAVMEAMACGVPVVATEDGGTVEILHDGVEGYLVARNDVGIAAERIMRLLNDGSLHEKMGRSGRTAIEKRYGLDTCIARHELLYGTLLNRRSVDGVGGS
ncbi:MAG: glycosyltransferase [Gammaproteobacteria bacterium]|nr:glycosyltransferase [Gammaproteobacteria bacterium]